MKSKTILKNEGHLFVFLRVIIKKKKKKKTHSQSQFVLPILGPAISWETTLVMKSTLLQLGHMYSMIYSVC